MLTLKNIYESVLDLPNISDKDLVEKTKQEIKQFLRDNYDGGSVFCQISDHVNSNGKFVVNCSSSLEVKNRNITSLTNGLFEFGEIKGGFSCWYCKKIVSLEGGPNIVHKKFSCAWCTELKTLEGAPKKVGGTFYCAGCDNLTDLIGAPKVVGEDFMCSYCSSLTSLKGAPKKVGCDFMCNDAKRQFSIEEVKKISKVTGTIVCKR
jgi:hypothetical protein